MTAPDTLHPHPTLAPAADPARLRLTAAVLSLAVGLAMLTGKASAYFLTGSTGILSDALESIVHVVATAFALYSVRLCARPADPRYPYGYGKIEYFSAGAEGLLIIVAALAILYEAGRSLQIGPKVHDLDLGVAIVGGLGLVNLALGGWLIRTGRKTQSLILVADGQHVLTDAYTSLGVVIALIVVLLTGCVLLDPLIAIAVALQILYTGGKIVRDAVHGLMNRSDQAFLARIGETLRQARRPEWIEIHRLRSFPNASNAHQIDLHLTVPRYWSVAEAHGAEQALETSLQTTVEAGIQCLVHLDPCTPRHCRHCGHATCGERSAPETDPAAWDLRALTGGPLVPPSLQTAAANTNSNAEATDNRRAMLPA